MKFLPRFKSSKLCCYHWHLQVSAYQGEVFLFWGQQNFKWTLRKGGREGVWPKRPVNINRGEYVDGPLVKKNDWWSSILGQLLYAGIKLIYMEN